MTEMDDWEGIANGDEYSINEKKRLRAGHDLPERVDRDLRQKLGVADEPAGMWLGGFVDLAFKDGLAHMGMTYAQAAVWQRIRESA